MGMIKGVCPEIVGSPRGAAHWGAVWLLWALLLVPVAVAADRLRSDDPGEVETAPEFPGRILRAAIEARDRGESRVAEEALARLAVDHPIIADHADLLRVGVLMEAHRYPDVVALRAAWKHSRSPLHGDFLMQRGRAYDALGKPEEARSAWGAAIAETDDSDRLAVLHLAVADSYARSGDLAAAAESYLRVWTAYPLRPEAEGAKVALDDLERRIEISVRTAPQYRKRADTLYRRRRNDLALEAYDLALASQHEPLSEADRRGVDEQRARTLFRLRRYDEATQAFSQLPDGDANAIWTARSQARAGDVEAAARALEHVGQQSSGNQSLRATLLAGMLWAGEGETQRAHALYSGLANRSPRSSYGRAALWKLGWQAYQDAKYDEAIAYFERLGEGDQDNLAALRPRYWRARAAEQAGQKDIVEEYARIAREFPLSYYGWRARSRSTEAVAPKASEPDDDPLERIGISLGSVNLTPRQLMRPRILLEAGLVDEARGELDRLFARARGREDRLALAELYANAGSYHRPQRLMVDAYSESLARGPAPGQLELWWHAWPAAFEDEVREAADSKPRLDPALVYAVMREESGYRPEVVSVSGARGLLQLMPETAERVARGAGISKPSSDDLFEPSVNIQLGAIYLGDLLGRFSGRTSAAIGSYNAGPEAVTRWLRKAPLEDDEWVEEIGYEQTRSYVKRVLRSLHAYRVLY